MQLDISLPATNLAVNPTAPNVAPSRPGVDHSAMRAPTWPAGLPMLAETTPQTTLDAALQLAEVGGVLAVDLYAKDGKRPVMRAYQDTLPWPRLERGIWYGSTRNTDIIARWFGPRGEFSGQRYGVGLALRDAGLCALDVDDARGAVELVRLVESVGGWGGPTFAVMSTRGPKLIYQRPAELAGLNHVRQKALDIEDRVGLAAIDVVLHYALLWAPGRRWYGSPADIATMPGGEL